MGDIGGGGVEVYIDIETIGLWLFVFAVLYYAAPIIARILYAPLWIGERLDRLHDALTLRLSRLFGIARKPQE